MTSSSEQPKEYIISERLLNHIITCSKRTEEIGCSGCPYEGNGVNCAISSWEDEIRSRPHPAPQEDGCKFRVAKMEAMYDNGYADGSRKAREDVLEAIQDHNDGRLKGMEILFATPSNERTESAQDAYLKEAYFELTLIKHLIDSLRTTTPQSEQEQPR